MSILTVDGGTLEGPMGVVLRDLSFSLSPGVTVLVGPSGSGKSALLRLLASQSPAPGWRVSGTWKRDPSRDASSVRWLPQERYRTPHPHESFSRPPAVAHWREVFDADAPFVLLDEPLRGVDDDEEDDLGERLVEHARQGRSAVVITHNLRFARHIADHVLFVCAHELQAACSADLFFEDPPGDLAAQFVKAGNCSLPAVVPPLPNHFRWIIDGRLAGMGVPGLLDDVDDDLTAIANAGVSMLVSLTEKPFDPQLLRSYGIQPRHLPIRDMQVPSLGKAATLCSQISSSIDRERAVALHCRAGLGRTGTMLAAMLVWRGQSADEAINEVRSICRHYIQRPAQLRFVHQFAEVHG